MYIFQSLKKTFLTATRLLMSSSMLISEVLMERFWQVRVVSHSIQGCPNSSNDQSHLNVLAMNLRSISDDTSSHSASAIHAIVASVARQSPSAVWSPSCSLCQR